MILIENLLAKEARQKTDSAKSCVLNKNGGRVNVGRMKVVEPDKIAEVQFHFERKMKN
jgi:hypothetical protein